jgi:hypothetical protein
MKRLKNESAFQRFLRKSISYCFLGNAATKKNHGNEYTERGVSDIDGHVHGSYVAIEAKMWGAYATTEQMAFLRRICRTGAIGLFVIYRYVEATQEHEFWWAPGDQPFSYRLKNTWFKTGLIEVPEDPRDPTNKNTTWVANCFPIMQRINENGQQGSIS